MIELPITSMDFHIILGTISGFIFITVGLLNLVRHRRNRIDQIFFGFFAFIALSQIFDALLVWFSASSVDEALLNLLRDISLVSLLLGLGCAAFTGTILHFGEERVFSRKYLMFEGVLTGLILFLGIFGDYMTSEEQSGTGGLHFAIERDILGWTGISGAFLIFSLIFLISLISLIPSAERDLKISLLKLITGFVLSVPVLFLFDISFAVPFVRQRLVEDYLINFVMRFAIVLGALSVFWAFAKRLESESS